MHSLARDHALADGNQQLAWSATRTFALLNGKDIRYDVDDAERLVVEVAAGELHVPEIAVWIAAHLVSA